MRDAVNVHDDEAFDAVTFFLGAITSERVRQMTIDKNGAAILTREWPYSP